MAKKAVVENLKLAGTIPFHPGLTLDMLDKFLTLDMLDKFLKLGLPEGSSKDHPVTCPMTEALPEFDLPPYLLCVAEEDLVIDTEMEFYERMKQPTSHISSSAHKTPSPYLSQDPPLPHTADMG